MSPTAPKSKTWMMFGWLRPSAIFASSTNIVTNWRLRAYAVWIFLMTRVLLRPCATVVRARKTSAIPPVPILRISVYLPNCSIPVGRADCSSQRRDHEVVEPGIRFPVVEARNTRGPCPRAAADLRSVEERLGHVVDAPRDRLALALDLPVVVLARRSTLGTVRSTTSLCRARRACAMIDLELYQPPKITLVAGRGVARRHPDRRSGRHRTARP